MQKYNTKTYRPVTDVYKGADEQDLLHEILWKYKNSLRVREWVDFNDLYVDELGDIYMVEIYNHEKQIEEGHGFHDVGTDTPADYLPFMSKNLFVANLHSYRERAEGEPWPLIVKVGLVAVVFAIVIIIAHPFINAWVDSIK